MPPVQTPKSNPESPHSPDSNGTGAQLLACCERWRELSGAEAKAIQNRDWASLLQYQAEKRTLSAEMAVLHETLLVQAGRAGVENPLAGELPAIVEQLVALESANVQALASRKLLLQQEQRRLRQAGRTLRQLQRAYASGPVALWHSYS